MSNMRFTEKLRHLISFHIEMWKLRGVPVTTSDLLAAIDGDRERHPQSRFARRCRAIAELELRDVLGVRRLDA